MRLTIRSAFRLSFGISVLVLLDLSLASAQVLRIAAYNIDADTGGSHGAKGGDIAGPGLNTVLQAIGNANLAGHAQPLDVLALEELNGTPSTTLNYIVTQLNSIYGPGTYAYDTTADLTTGNTLTGNGPSGLVYNTNTVQVLGAKYIGTASGSGAPRAPMRYTLAPKGYDDHSADFTMYVSHMKANSGSGDNIGRRNFEAGEIRDDAATLGASAHIIYSGDLNILNSSESTYQTLIAQLSPTAHINAGQAMDTLNPANNWTQASSFRNLFTESANSLSARFDFQLVTSPMTNQPGMQLVPNSLTPFGNNGSVTNVSNSSATNTALLDLAQSPFTPTYRQSVLTALTTATDHLPIVADYSFATALGAPADYDHSGLVDNADYILWTNSFGSTTTLAADGNHDGIVDAADYSVWRDNLISPGAGAGRLTGTAVPEPNAVMLLFGGCLLGLSVGRLNGWTRRN